MNYASFWKRVAAWMIDCVFFGIVSCLVCCIVGIILSITMPLIVNDNNHFVCSLMMALIFWGGFLGAYLAYYVWPESSSWQATIGKKLLGLKVTDTNGQRISFWRSLGRNVGMIVSTVILYIGYLMCLWAEKRQCLHDQMADCLVIDTDTQNNRSGCLIVVIVGVFFLFVAMFIGGILSAIAMPQYFKAVEKARAAEALTLLGTVTAAQQRHYLVTDHCASTFDQLDVDFPGATGNVFYTQSNATPSGNREGFRISLSSDTSYERGHVTARRVTNGTDNESVAYSLTRYYAAAGTECTGHNENGASVCRNICGVDDLSNDRTCCTDGTIGHCPRK